MESKLRFTQEKARQENEWAMQLFECRKRFCDQVTIALQTRSPTRRKELYEGWRKEFGDAATRDWARYAESVYAGGDTKLLEILRKMTQEAPNKLPSYMILGDSNV